MKVGLGKYYFDNYYKSEDSSILSEVRELLVPNINGGLDMGLVDLIKNVELTTNIWPACVDWSSTFVPSSDTMGIVSWWKRRDQDAYEVAQLNYLEPRQYVINLYGDKFKDEFIQSVKYNFFGTSRTNETVVRPVIGQGYTTLHNGSYHVVGVFLFNDPFSTAKFHEIKHSLTWLAAEKNRLEDIHKA